MKSILARLDFSKLASTCLVARIGFAWANLREAGQSIPGVVDEVRPRNAGECS
jgi:hypothetical protein